jgi:hypothetical protein
MCPAVILSAMLRAKDLKSSGVVGRRKSVGGAEGERDIFVIVCLSVCRKVNISNKCASVWCKIIIILNKRK